MLPVILVGEEETNVLLGCSVIGFEKYASEVDFIRKWVSSSII